MRRKRTMMKISSDFLSSVTGNLAVVTFDKRRNITYASDAFAEVMGYSKDELLQMQHRDLCFEAFANSAEYEEFWDRLLAGDSFQDQVLRKGKNGKQIFLEANYFPLKDEKNNLTGISKICFDKTENTSAINSALNDISSVSGSIDQMYDGQMKQMDETKQMMLSLQNSSAANIENTSSLKSNTDQIQQVTNTVHEIAYHTNILAVNTALQAVRSNDNSNGFSVVAKEMRKLSKEVDQSSDDIKETLQKILHAVDDLDKTANKTSEQIKSAISGFSQNQKSLYELKSSSDKIKENVGSLNQLFSVKQVG